jgi:hypothetical protein
VIGDPVTVNGKAGELRHGYRTLARLKGWTLTKERCVCDPSDVIGADFPPELTEPGTRLSLRLEVGTYVWTYPAVTLVSLGPPIVVRFAGSPDVKTIT